MKWELLYKRKIQYSEYNSVNTVLKICFKSNIIKEFLNVPEDLYINFEHATDKEKFFRDKIEGVFCIK